MGDEITPGIDEQPGEQSAAAVTSHLTSLRDRRAKVREELTVDFAVPRYDPPIYVRYRPLTQGQITVANKRAEKSKDPSTAVTANAVLLADACIGIFQVVGGRELSVDIEHLDGDWPRFDDRLGQLLGERVNNASDAVKALFHTDGDILATAGKLAEWSGYSTEDLEREYQGN